MRKRELSLNLFMYTGGHHEAAWRYAGASKTSFTDIAFDQEIARRAEKAGFDALFYADAPVLADNIRYATRFRLEPITWLSAIASVTSRIGLIATASTTYSEPYNLARQFASLDTLSGGRAGWNIVTTAIPQASLNFGRTDHPGHAQRYDTAREFVEVVSKLWDSWEDGAVVSDYAAGIFVDTDKVHAINHSGEHYNVAGPLNLPRSPQGRPVFVQAGSSEAGRAFAARYAEVVFAVHQSIENAQEFYGDLKRRAESYGRNPDHIRILPGICPIIGATEEEAWRLEREINGLIQLDYSFARLKRIINLDLSSHDPDAPFPRHLLDASGDPQVIGRFRTVIDFVERRNATLRQVLEMVAGARGHFVKVGTPEQVADEMELWFRNGAADGFNVMPPWFTGGFDAFVDGVVPILRKRGIIREEYRGTTLRDHYGLPRPASQYAGA